MDAYFAGRSNHCVGARSAIFAPFEEIGLIMACNYSRAPLGAIRDGVLDILLGYVPEIPRQQIGMAFARVYADRGLDAAKEFYNQARTEESDDYAFGDMQLNAVGYYFLRENLIGQAIEIFEYNVELYPEVGNVYDSLGEAYMLNGDRDLAIENYRRALELEPDNANAREKLAELGASGAAS